MFRLGSCTTHNEQRMNFDRGSSKVQVYPVATRKDGTCISEDSNPGHINGNDDFYHFTSEAEVGRSALGLLHMTRTRVWGNG